MISSGGASLCSWHQLYSRVFICNHSVVIRTLVLSHEVYYHSMAGMQPVTAVPTTQIISSQAAGQALSFMILDILEHGIKAGEQCSHFNMALSSSHTALPRFD